jgi:hypothetical protein
MFIVESIPDGIAIKIKILLWVRPPIVRLHAKRGSK